LKKISYILLGFFIFFSCNNKKADILPVSNNEKVNDLLLKSEDFKINAKSRISNADSVIPLLRNMKNDSLTRNYYFKLSDIYYSLEENQKNIEICRIIYNMSKSSYDTLSIAKSLYYIGDYHFGKFSNDSAYYYYTKAEKTYESHNYKVDISRLKFNKANILFYEKDFSGCETAVIEVLKIAKETNNIRLVHDCYITLANSVDGLNNSQNALEYYKKAFDATNQLKKDPQYLMLKGQTYNYIGRIYQKKQDYNKATNYFKLGLKFDDFKKTLPFLYANLVNNLGYSNFKLNNKIALSQLNEAYKIRDSIQNKLGIVTSKINLSEYYLVQKDTARAFAYSTEAKKVAHENNFFEDELKALQLLTQIDPKNNSAYNNRYIKLSDSLQNNERATRNKFARIEFETNEIISQKNTIEAEKNQISSQRWIILGFSVFALLVLGLLYVTKMQHAKNKELQYEQDQQKANEEIYQLMLDQQGKIDEGRSNEKKRISQELHDGVMSRLTSTRLNLFILSRRTDEETIKKCLTHIADIQNIEKEIRAISHDLASDLFTKRDSFKIIIEALFESQKDISNAHWQLEIDPDINWDNIESNAKMHIYRILQEALQNIHKYAQAENIFTKMSKTENLLDIKINDDGVGFDTNKNIAGIGLKNMSNRIKTIGGELHIDSKIGSGTIINLIIPI
jgi:signal transduction histidine kinase